MTAEFAAALPAVLLGLALCLAAIQVISQQATLVEASATAARLLGRGDDGPPLSAGQSRTIHHEEGMLCVRITAPADAVGLGTLGMTVSARSCALDERAWEEAPLWAE